MRPLRPGSLWYDEEPSGAGAWCQRRAGHRCEDARAHQGVPHPLGARCEVL
jgi:hypothetical protein